MNSTPKNKNFNNDVSGLRDALNEANARALMLAVQRDCAARGDVAPAGCLATALDDKAGGAQGNDRATDQRGQLRDLGGRRAALVAGILGAVERLATLGPNAEREEDNKRLMEALALVDTGARPEAAGQ